MLGTSIKIIILFQGAKEERDLSCALEYIEETRATDDATRQTHPTGTQIPGRRREGKSKSKALAVFAAILAAMGSDPSEKEDSDATPQEARREAGTPSDDDRAK